jgi:hypothetical protein
MNFALRMILNRFKEPSSWAGLAGMALAAGVSAPAFAAVSLIGAGICGALAVILPENK